MKKAYTKEIKKFGKRVKKIRAEKNLTQLQLSDSCEVDIRTIQRIEAGNYPTGLHILHALAEAFDMKLSELFED